MEGRVPPLLFMSRRDLPGPSASGVRAELLGPPGWRWTTLRHAEPSGLVQVVNFACVCVCVCLRVDWGRHPTPLYVPSLFYPVTLRMVTA